jgi:hypothetical protein
MKMRRLRYAALKCRRRRLGRCSFIIFRSLPYLSARFNTSVTRRRSAPVPFIFSRRRQQVDRRTNVSRKSVVGDTHTREREVSLLRNITPPDNFWLSPTMTEFITIIEPLSFYIPPPPSVCICAYIYSLQSLHLNTPMAHWRKKKKKKNSKKFTALFFVYRWMYNAQYTPLVRITDAEFSITHPAEYLSLSFLFFSYSSVLYGRLWPFKNLAASNLTGSCE